ncbi:MAG: OmpA family protein [Bacteroidales bacterium]|nr:OmpA family protein [Bacteroidales bacterium]
MKKKHFILTISILILGLLYADAQVTQIFKDDFNDNKNKWLQNELFKIKNGNFYISCESKYIFRMAFQELAFNSKKDYYIETRIKQTEGSLKEGYGIVWGTASWKNSLIFDIASEGWFRIYGYKNGKLFYIKKATWKKDIIKAKYSYNKLAIKKTGNYMYFYINGTKVFSTSSYDFSGYNTGLIVGQECTAASDYFLVKAEKKSINLVSSNISKYSKENMGLNINSPYSEIAPVISPDGKTLYIARANHPLNEKPISKYDIWYSTKNSNGTWSKLKKAPKPLNNSGDNVVISVTPDNNTLFLETLYNSDGSFKSDQGISVSYRTVNGWSIPKKINIKNYYNNNIYESFAFTGNQSVLVMSIERNDSYGEKDMYVSFLQNDGSYSEPKNMGPVLNSYLGEGTPYIAPDNKTMYFYSFTEAGYGDADIFVSKRLDNSWTKWSTPKNLGKKINSDQWDVYYTVAAEGDYAYLVSSKTSFGNEDIFKIKLRDEEKPEPVVIVYGKVLDNKTKKPISAPIVYENDKTGKIEGQARSNPKTGEYKIVLPYGVKYNIRANKDGYFAMNEAIDLRAVKDYKEVKKNLFMSPLEKEEAILLKDVNFYTTKATLLPASYPELNRLVKLMKKNTALVIEIQGHTEATPGYEKQLMYLSEKRAEAVKQYLILKGISSSRIKKKAFGGTKPIADNNSEGGRKKNRRVEFKILQK